MGPILLFATVTNCKQTIAQCIIMQFIGIQTVEYQLNMQNIDYLRQQFCLITMDGLMDWWTDRCANVIKYIYKVLQATANTK